MFLNNVKIAVFFFVLVFFFSCANQKSQHEKDEQGTMYINPVLPGFYPDPSICKAEGYFYMTHSTFQFFPGCPLFRSADLIHWEQIGNILDRKSQLAIDSVFSSGGVFAPTLRYHNGTFYLITTLIGTPNGGNFFVTAQNPAEPWSEPVNIDMPGYDPDLFFDESGRVYVTVSNGKAIVQSEIEIETGKLLSDPRVIWEGTGGRFPEGPHLYKKDEYYYLLISEGGTEYGHYVVIARSKSVDGPFESAPNNPILTHRDRGNHTLQATGHADFVRADDGSWWVVFLGFRKAGWSYHHLGRETFLAPVNWKKNLWPVIYNNGEVEYEMYADLLEQVPIRQSYAETDFSDTLGHEWLYLRNPDISNFCVRNNELQIVGNRYTLDDVQSPSFVGVRQRQFDVVLETKVRLTGKEAGLSVFMDEDHHYELGIKKNNEGYTVFSRATIGSLSNELKSISISDNRVTMYIYSDKEYYYFNTIIQNDTISLGKMECRYLSSEVASGFTGVILGMYVYGNRSRAIFDYFHYMERNVITPSVSKFESDE
jgi:xylan 1,4-beta-xylosidase